MFINLIVFFFSFFFFLKQTNQNDFTDYFKYDDVYFKITLTPENLFQASSSLYYLKLRHQWKS